MNEVDLPWFRSTFHGFEVTVNHDNDKVCLLKRHLLVNHLMGKEQTSYQRRRVRQNLYVSNYRDA